MDKYFNDYNLNELVKVDDRFQNSINIQLDLNKIEKILSYIPTKSSVEILKRYLENIVFDSREKSTLLIGPYGKGKSHLLLVLLSLLSMDMTEESNNVVKEVTNRIKLVDEEVADLINVIRSRNKRYLPVIVSNTQMDLNQAFLLALNEALKRNGLSDIQPNTYYAEAINIINNWEENYPNTFKALGKALKEVKMSVAKLKMALNMYNKEALDLFSEIYPSLTAGSVFNPLINTDVLHLYMEVNTLLCDEYGFGGMFIVFDEFSKYIEGHDIDTIASDMKVLQDMCELSNASKDNQIHTLLIAHKSIKQYNNVLPKEVINSFTGVEGRLKEVLFVTSSQNNYELIQNAIIKTDLYYDLLNKGNYNDLSDQEVYEVPAFKSLFNYEDFKRIVVQGCFPLTSVAAYLLLGISEKVAQNERTLFTFISKDEPYSMARIIREHKKGRTCFISADCIYDYFKSIFKNDVANPLIHGEWLKTDYAIKQTKDENEIKIIKTLAILNIINRKDEIPPKMKYLGLSAGLMDADAITSLERLVNKNIIEYRSSNGIYYFKNKVGIELDREIKRTLDRLSGKINLVDTLSKIIKYGYVSPKIHNQEKSIKRYFESKYMIYEDFLQLTSSKVLFDKFADGKILYLLSLDGIDMEKCQEHLNKLNDSRLVLVLANKKFVKETTLKRYLALEDLKQNKIITSDNKVMSEEIEIYKEEIRQEIGGYLERLFDLGNSKTRVLHVELINEAKQVKTSKDLNRFISLISDKIYINTPIINNEMINKHNISSQIKAARNSLVNRILNKLDVEDLYRGTAPEASIFRATLLYTGVQTGDYTKNKGLELMLKQIKAFILSAEGKKVSFNELYSLLINPPYGIRKGVIPIYIAFCLRCIEDTPIIYVDDKEIGLDADVLSRINENPDGFSLYMEKGTKEKEVYLDSLTGLFEKYSKIQDLSVNKMTQIVYCMQRWMQSLPNASSNFKYNEAILSMTIEQFNGLNMLRKILKRVECNPRELLFEIIPKIFKDELLLQSFENIKIVKEETDAYIVQLKKQVINITKDVFGKNNGEDLTTILKSWYSSQSESAKNVLVSTKISNFMNYISCLDTYDESDIISNISKVVLDIHIENWGDSTFEEYKNELIQLKQEIELTVDSKSDISSKSKIILNTGGKQVERYYDEVLDDSVTYFLRNELENVLDEFGDTLEINQKVSVLVQLIKVLVN